MNERIRLLAVQAGLALKPRRPYDDKEPDGYLESDLDYLENNLEATRMFFKGGLEKFAELIVAECADIALEQKKWVEEQVVFDPRDQSWNKARIQQSQRIADKIQEHFGVE